MQPLTDVWLRCHRSIRPAGRSVNAAVFWRKRIASDKSPCNEECGVAAHKHLTWWHVALGVIGH